MSKPKLDPYLKRLIDEFCDLKIEIVYFDNGATPESMQAYILVSNISKERLKDKGSFVLDCSNYLYRRFGLIYEMCPEFSRTEEPRDSLAFYISKKKFEKMPHLKDWLLDQYNKKNKRNKSRTVYNALYNQKRFVLPKEKQPKKGKSK